MEAGTMSSVPLKLDTLPTELLQLIAITGGTKVVLELSQVNKFFRDTCYCMPVFKAIIKERLGGRKVRWMEPLTEDAPLSLWAKYSQLYTEYTELPKPRLAEDLLTRYVQHKPFLSVLNHPLPDSTIIEKIYKTRARRSSPKSKYGPLVRNALVCEGLGFSYGCMVLFSSPSNGTQYTEFDGYSIAHINYIDSTGCDDLRSIEENKPWSMTEEKQGFMRSFTFVALAGLALDLENKILASNRPSKNDNSQDTTLSDFENLRIPGVRYLTFPGMPRPYDIRPEESAVRPMFEYISNNPSYFNESEWAGCKGTFNRPRDKLERSITVFEDVKLTVTPAGAGHLDISSTGDLEFCGTLRNLFGRVMIPGEEALDNPPGKQGYRVASVCPFGILIGGRNVGNIRSRAFMNWIWLWKKEWVDKDWLKQYQDTVDRMAKLTIS